MQLFREEILLHCNIVSCRRFGKPFPGKTQLLTVCMSGPNILAAAKRLRHSPDNYICHVYTNRDRTKSEGEAAYHARCRKRLKQGSKNQLQSSIALHQISNKKQTTNVVGDTRSSSDGQTNHLQTQHMPTAPPLVSQQLTSYCWHPYHQYLNYQHLFHIRVFLEGGMPNQSLSAASHPHWQLPRFLQANMRSITGQRGRKLLIRQR
jgi:hypothetical protein